MPITPDTKNWTWVVERPCPECGFNANDYPREMVARTMRSNAAAWVPVLSRADARVRPNDERWSALEYACHVRDVYRIFDVRPETEHRLEANVEDPIDVAAVTRVPQ